MLQMKNLLFILLVLIHFQLHAQNVGIGTLTPDPSAILDIKSGDKGLLIPSMPTIQREMIASPANGLLVYDTDIHQFCYYVDSVWTKLGKQIFEEVNGVVKYTGSVHHNFIFGRDSMPANGDTLIGDMFFYDDSRSAFRAGRLFNSSNWNPDSIGLMSIAMGNSTLALGDVSTAFGNQTEARKINSTAMGLKTIAKGKQSTSMGNQSVSTGINSTALGFKTFAKGRSSTAMGTITTSNGISSTSMGRFTNAQSYSSVAIGRHNEGLGDSNNWISTDPVFEIGIGADSLNLQNALTVLKDGTLSLKEYTLPNIDGTANQVLSTDGNGNVTWVTDLKGAFENNGGVVRNTGTNNDDFVFGLDELPQNGISYTENLMFFDESKGAFRAGRLVNSTNWSTDSLGIRSIAFGFNTLASGENSFAAGLNSEATGSHSTSLGYGNKARGLASTALGTSTLSEGEYATSIGFHTRARSFASISLGRFNAGLGDKTMWIASDPILEVGIGTDASNRENALTILKNGTISFKDYTFPNVDGISNQLLSTDGSGNISWTDLTAIGLSELSDADNDTKIEVEKTPDEDIIRMKIANSEVLRLSSSLSTDSLNIDAYTKFQSNKVLMGSTNEGYDGKLTIRNSSDHLNPSIRLLETGNLGARIFFQNTNITNDSLWSIQGNSKDGYLRFAYRHPNDNTAAGINFRFEKTGKFHIGGNNPLANLHVDGDALIKTNSSVSKPHIVLKESEIDASRIEYSNTQQAGNWMTSGFVGASNGASEFTIDYDNGTSTETIIKLKGNRKVTVNNLLNVTPRNTVPSSPSVGDIYMDDGTNVGGGTPTLRYYNGTTWVNM